MVGTRHAVSEEQLQADERPTIIKRTRHAVPQRHNGNSFSHEVPIDIWPIFQAHRLPYLHTKKTNPQYLAIEVLRIVYVYYKARLVP